MFFVENNTDEKINLENIERLLSLLIDYYDEKRNFSVSFVTDEEIERLNKQYRDISSPTDILTFVLEDGDMEFPTCDEEEEELGDIFISLESMRRNALSFSVKEEEELVRLLLHGLLHLRGMDHKTNDFATEETLIEQERVLKEILKRV